MPIERFGKVADSKDMSKNEASELANKKRKIDENCTSVLSEMNVDVRVVERSAVENPKPISTGPPRRPLTPPTNYLDDFEFEEISNGLRGGDSSSTTISSKRPIISGDFKYLNVLLPSGRDIKLKMHSKDSDVLKYVPEIVFREFSKIHTII